MKLTENILKDWLCAGIINSDKYQELLKTL